VAFAGFNDDAFAAIDDVAVGQAVETGDAAAGNGVDDLNLVGVGDEGGDFQALAIDIGFEAGEGAVVAGESGVGKIGFEVAVEDTGAAAIESQVEFVAGLGVVALAAFVAKDGVVVFGIGVIDVFIEEVVLFGLVGIVGGGEESLVADFAFGEESGAAAGVKPVVKPVVAVVARSEEVLAAAAWPRVSSPTPTKIMSLSCGAKKIAFLSSTASNWAVMVTSPLTRGARRVKVAWPSLRGSCIPASAGAASLSMISPALASMVMLLGRGWSCLCCRGR